MSKNPLNKILRYSAFFLLSYVGVGLVYLESVLAEKDILLFYWVYPDIYNIDEIIPIHGKLVEGYIDLRYAKKINKIKQEGSFLVNILDIRNAANSVKLPQVAHEKSYLIFEQEFAKKAEYWRNFRDVSGFSLIDRALILNDAKIVELLR